jgi:methyl-accepting chemotaxis protein
MNEPRGLDREAAAETAWRIPLLLRRRRFVVDPRSQWRASAMVGGLVLLLLVLLDLSLILAGTHSRQAALQAAPELGRLLRAQDRLEILLLVAISVVFLIGVLVVGLLETHRTAGAAYAIERGLERLGEARFGTRVRLRKGDNLQSLAEAFNRAASRLEAAAREEIAELDEIAADLPPDPAARLRAAAARKRQALG